MRICTPVLLFILGLTQIAQAAGDPYTTWAEKHFGSTSLSSSAQEFSQWGEHADPDGDGLDNVLEYALDSDPLAFSLPPTATNTPVTQLTGDRSAFVITATIRTDDPELVVFPQISADNATWLPFATQRIDVNLAESFYVLKVEEISPRRGLKQVTWAVRPDLVGIDPHYLRLTAIREASPTTAPAAESQAVPKATSRPVRRVLAAQASTPAIPGLVFTSQNTAAVGADLLSNTVVLRGLKGKVLVTAPAGVTLIVNGIDRGQSYSVGNGDTLALKTKAPGIADQSLERRIQVGSGSVLWKIGARRAATLTPPGGIVAGYTPVSASVGQGGDANLSIPITVSPGIGGIEPKLSINYNSQGGNGHLGVGFSLGGMSAITRAGANEAVDGFRGSVTFASTDRFALDGARLIATVGNDGENGTTYEKELHDFSRIRSSGRIGNGPEQWTVETKAGLKMEYGATEGARRVWAGSNEILIWFLSTVKDTVGNEMRFSYVHEDGDSRLRFIHYTANGAKAPENSVEFSYEGRPDPSTSYFRGEAKVLQHRLTAIVCKHGTRVVRRYDLSYQQAELSGKSQLTEVMETGADSDDGNPGPSFAPTAFTWNATSAPNMSLVTAAQAPSLGQMGFSNSPPSFTLQGDFNGDGRMDILQLDDHGKSGSWIAFGQSNGSFDYRAQVEAFDENDKVYQSSGNLRTGDFNGDGKSDVLYIDTNSARNFVAISNGDGTFAVKRDAQLGALENATFSSSYSQVLVLDTNGDGLTDVVVVNPSDNANLQNRVYLATTAGSFAEVANPGQEFQQVRVSNDRPTYSWIIPGDYNGDGLADILHLYWDGNGHWLAISNGDGTFTVRTGAQLGGLAGLAFARSYSYMVSADYNGDGLTDIVNFKDRNSKEVFVSICKGARAIDGGGVSS